MYSCMLGGIEGPGSELELEVESVRASELLAVDGEEEVEGVGKLGGAMFEEKSHGGAGVK